MINSTAKTSATAQGGAQFSKILTWPADPDLYILDLSGSHGHPIIAVLYDIGSNISLRGICSFISG